MVGQVKIVFFPKYLLFYFECWILKLLYLPLVSMQWWFQSKACPARMCSSWSSGQCTVKCKMYFRKFPIVFVAIVKWGTMHMSNCQIAYLHQFPNSFDNCKIYPSGGVAANLWGQCTRQDNLSPLALCQGIHCKYLSPLWFSEHESLWILGTQWKEYCVTDHLVCSIFVTQDLKPFCNKKKGSLTHLVAVTWVHHITQH